MYRHTVNFFKNPDVQAELQNLFIKVLSAAATELGRSGAQTIIGWINQWLAAHDVKQEGSTEVAKPKP